ncbi:MAG: hypothetical protein WC058_05880 [Phycisphaeraceae bacterium]
MSSDAKDPLSDALNALHDTDADAENLLKRDAALDQHIDSALDGEEDLDLGHFPADDVDGSTQDLSELTAFASPDDAGSPRQRPAPRPKIRRPTQLHHTGVKLCLIIGMLLLIPGLWAVGILLGLNVPMAYRTSARGMAYLMLVCWPVAAALIGGSIHYARHLAEIEARFDAAEEAEIDEPNQGD